jgi:3'-5' exonuclease
MRVYRIVAFLGSLANGAQVAQYYRDGRIREIAAYCESDVVNTYRLWLRYAVLREAE